MNAVRFGKLVLIGLLTLIAAVALYRFTELRLDARPSGPIGPFLQSPAPDAITVRWRSEEPTAERVFFRPEGASEWQAEGDGAMGTDHRVRLSGLAPATRYQYRLGDSAASEPLASFRTSPAPGDPGPHRLWLLGDPGVNNPVAHAVRDQSLAWMESNPIEEGRPLPDLILTSGDNAYPSGRDRDFRDGFFATYAEQLPFVPLWPAHGNHDARRTAYERIFDLPTRGEAGGEPSGSEFYYSFDHGNAHFVVLDSEQHSLDPDGAMGRWLRQDLARTEADWIIVIVHRAPFSRGSNDADEASGSDWRQLDIRDRWMPILEQHGVDLIIAGHSHGYERSRMVGGFHTTADRFDDSFLMGDGNGSVDNPYRRPRRCDESCGTVYLVAGMSALPQTGPLDHPMMAHSEATGGAVILDIDGLELTGRYLRIDGSIGDHFSIVKSDP
ncbi:purple acid phosphatase family protein [Wenzhouxiangella marina]|uniref:Uncharacterized protein n=1 Tax=Wenzhouxiangella marina TaxID=1579979 RepID=A0A0K0XUI6_9GAMM|nr:metallophosphoesterase family protein [Wenzhouxiangella marina]AKS41281.1 hypothetical protein WM2015_900 [Wenzhouxiangella marina]MBB6086969.1 hypothetical protein [Wenzhouxiangella marina]